MFNGLILIANGLGQESHHSVAVDVARNNLRRCSQFRVEYLGRLDLAPLHGDYGLGCQGHA